MSLHLITKKYPGKPSWSEYVFLKIFPSQSSSLAPECSCSGRRSWELCSPPHSSADRRELLLLHPTHSSASKLLPAPSGSTNNKICIASINENIGQRGICHTQRHLPAYLPCQELAAQVCSLGRSHTVLTVLSPRGLLCLCPRDHSTAFTN